MSNFGNEQQLEINLEPQQVRNQAINILIAAARKGQQAGAYSLQEASQIYSAVQTLVGAQTASSQTQ